MTHTRELTSQQAWYLRIGREAKESRDADGIVNEALDARLERMERGDFAGLIGPETGRGRTHTPEGQQGQKPEMVARVEDGRMIGTRPGRGGDGMVSYTPKVSPMSEPQKKYIVDLLVKLGLAGWEDIDKAAAWFGTAHSTMTSPQASDTIRRLKGHLVRLSEIVGTPTTPTVAIAPQRASDRARWTPDMLHTGRYAVDTEAGHVAFYRVRESKRTGNLYLVVMASDEERFIPFPAADAILRKIAADPKAAAARYGKEIGSCGFCHRTLTDDHRKGPDGLTSIQRGIGPDCAKDRGLI